MFARVKREIQYLKLLRHPHIIKLYEVISTPTSIYMVIEYAGGELFNYIVDNTRLSEDEARRFFQQIVCAIEYCHRHKIVHRDLKPENLLLDPSMNVKIADFGLSNIMTDGDFLKTSCGSPNYAAPEVISGKLYAGPEVDVWSCGVILYVMLCGRLPFDDDYIPLLFKKINGGIYSLPSFLSPETKYLLTSMLVVDPLKRITIAEIRKNAWFNVGLPDYLQPLPQGSADDSLCNLQEDIITELMKKMNFSRETIVQALEERQNNQIKVAYQLVVDHRRMIENASQMAPQKPFQSFLATSPPPWNATEKDASPNKSATGSSVGSALKSGLEGDTSDDSIIDSPVPSSIAVLSTSLPGNSLAKELHRKASLKNTRRGQSSSQPQSPTQPASPSYASSDYTTAAFHQTAVLGSDSIGGGIPTPSKNNLQSLQQTNVAQGSTQRRLKSRPKWYFGIRSRSAPKEVMAEIYRALSNLSMKWKIINTYHLRTKYEYAEGFEVKIELQLYRLDIDNYLVDFKYVGQQSQEELATRAELLKSINEQSRADSRSGTNSSPGGVYASDGVAESTTSVDGVGQIVSAPQDIPHANSGSSVAGGAMMTAPALGGHSLLAGTVQFQSQGHSLGTAEGVSNHLAGTSGPTSTTGPGILSASLLQEQQQLKEMNEMRQECQHHKRQLDQKQRPTHLLFPRASYQIASAKEVTSPFPFFDVCGKLITELAIGSG
ncbi:5'-AMP-activated protein kinase, catalytic alpha subunit [Entomortierella parvispora]|uniref:non-specific serine/threonine protein kinase n=1 Tax=Entomortierella parvispora TaxID=205924 RepID=A0A9P3H916_9FUNG|nr:5'-AMP-activated protein kinase, catalytic alpha subunit [Entomortierella parvispora]